MFFLRLLTDFFGRQKRKGKEKKRRNNFCIFFLLCCLSLSQNHAVIVAIIVIRASTVLLIEQIPTGYLLVTLQIYSFFSKIFIFSMLWERRRKKKKKKTKLIYSNFIYTFADYFTKLSLKKEGSI